MAGEAYRVNLKPGNGSTIRYMRVRHDGEAFRVAWHQQQRRGCEACQGEGFRVDTPGNCHECGGKGWSKPMVMTVGRDQQLVLAIAVARGELRRHKATGEIVGGESGLTTPSLDSQLLADYCYATPWGRLLPGAPQNVPAIPPDLAATSLAAQ